MTYYLDVLHIYLYYLLFPWSIIISHIKIQWEYQSSLNGCVCAIPRCSKMLSSLMLKPSTLETLRSITFMLIWMDLSIPQSIRKMKIFEFQKTSINNAKISLSTSTKLWTLSDLESYFILPLMESLPELKWINKDLEDSEQPCKESKFSTKKLNCLMNIKRKTSILPALNNMSTKKVLTRMLSLQELLFFGMLVLESDNTSKKG